MIDFYEVIKASEGIAVADEFAALWGRKLAGGYTVETYAGTLPAILEGTVGGSLVSYKIWGNTGGVGVKKTNLAEGEQLLRNASMGSDGTIVTTSSNFAFRLIPVVEGREYSIVNIYGAEESESANFYAFFEELPQIGSVAYNEIRYSFKTPSRTFVAPITGYLAASDYYPMYDEQHSNLIPLEVYEGNASPYYLPIVSSSETTNVCIGRAALGEDEYVDSEEKKVWKRTENLLKLDRVESRTFTVDNRYYLYGAAANTFAMQNDKIVSASIAQNHVEVHSLTGAGIGYIVEVKPNTTYTVSFDLNVSVPNGRSSATINTISNDNVLGTYVAIYGNTNARTLTTLQDTKFLFIVFRVAGTNAIYENIMLAEGSTSPETYVPYLTPTDPPVPLPQIPTFAGETTISYGGGTGAQPEKVELKYKYRR